MGFYTDSTNDQLLKDIHKKNTKIEQQTRTVTKWVLPPHTKKNTRENLVAIEDDPK